MLYQVVDELGKLTTVMAAVAANPSTPISVLASMSETNDSYPDSIDNGRFSIGPGRVKSRNKRTHACVPRAHKILDTRGHPFAERRLFRRSLPRQDTL